MSAVDDSAHVIYNCKLQAMECTHCGEQRELKLPMTLTRTAKVLQAYATLHADCPPPAPRPLPTAPATG